MPPRLRYSLCPGPKSYPGAFLIRRRVYCPFRRSGGCAGGKSASATDVRMIRKAQSGDIHAFEQLYNLHRRRVFSLCLRVVGDISQAIA
jgi:hypothetical protein